MKAVPLLPVRFIKNNVYLMDLVSCYYFSTRLLIIQTFNKSYDNSYIDKPFYY